MDMIIFKKTWEDQFCFEVEIYAKANTIATCMKSYTTAESINMLADGIKKFAVTNNGEYLWENGEKGDHSTPFVSMDFRSIDKIGHIIIEIYMEIDDGASLDKHNCCFFVKTERGLIDRFENELRFLSHGDIGSTAILGIDGV